jgi:hypothetical protein
MGTLSEGKKIEGEVLHCLHGGAERGRNLKSRIVLRTTAEGGERFALVLEFKFLSRIIASMQSMRC